MPDNKVSGNVVYVSFAEAPSRTIHGASAMR
jgi:hypothetical protein